MLGQRARWLLLQSASEARIKAGESVLLSWPRNSPFLQFQCTQAALKLPLYSAFPLFFSFILSGGDLHLAYVPHCISSGDYST